MRDLPNALAVLIVLAVFAFLVSVLFRFDDIPFDSDEATHALDGAQLAADLYHGDIAGLLEHVYFIHWYPPLLPAYLAPFFLILKPTFWSARLPMLFLLTVYLAFSYRIAKALANRPLAGLITMSLAATSPLMWLYGLLCMEEMLSMIGTLLVVYAFAKGHSPYWVGILMAFTLLSRLPVGIYTAGGVFIALVLGPNSLKVKFDRGWRMFAPLAIVSLLWWAHPAKIVDFVSYLRASAPAYDVWGWQELVYYARAILTSYTVAPLIGFLALVTLFVAIFRWRDVAVRLPLAIVLAAWVTMVIKRQLNLRFFFSTVPMIFLLIGYLVARDGRRLSGYLKSRGLGWSVGLVVALVIASSIPYLAASVISFPFLAEVSYEVSDDSTAIHSWIEGVTPRDTPVFLVNGWDHFSGPALDFHLCSQRWPAWRGVTVTSVLLVDPERHPEAVARFQQAVFAASPSYIVHLGNTPVPNAGAWWAYHAAIVPCTPDDWQASSTFFLSVWDGQLQRDILDHPFRYAVEENQALAREEKLYILRMRVKGVSCVLQE